MPKNGCIEMEPMPVLDWFKALWPAVVLVAGVVLRIEVGQALNKQRLNTIEEDAAAQAKSVDKAVEAIHARLSRHETATNQVLAEIRNDIKTLLSRQ